jgi:hypothetical protein
MVEKGAAAGIRDPSLVSKCHQSGDSHQGPIDAGKIPPLTVHLDFHFILSIKPLPISDSPQYSKDIATYVEDVPVRVSNDSPDFVRFVLRCYQLPWITYPG